MAVVALVEDTEIAHLDHIVDQFLAEFLVGRAEEVLVLETEVELEGEHRGGGEAGHAEALQRLHDGPAFSSRQRAKHVIIVHHLPETQSSFQVMAEHVSHTEDSVEDGVGIGQRCICTNRGVLLQPTL